MRGMRRMVCWHQVVHIIEDRFSVRADGIELVKRYLSDMSVEKEPRRDEEREHTRTEATHTPTTRAASSFLET